MSYEYSNPTDDANCRDTCSQFLSRTLPDIEVFHLSEHELGELNADAPEVRTDQAGERLSPGWYWWPCLPGCLPDGEPMGPFETKELALKDAREE
jgi:hypothetical protein